MAIALYFGNTNHCEYHSKDFDAFRWPNYSAWTIFKRHPKFYPPNLPPPDDEVEASKDNKTNNGSNNDLVPAEIVQDTSGTEVANVGINNWWF